MSANFNITIYSKSIIGLSLIVGIVHSEMGEIDSLNVEKIDDWDYSNQSPLEISDDFQNIDKYIFDKKIVISNFRLNGKCRCGYRCYSINDNLFETTLWFNLKGLEYLDVDQINNNNKIFYDAATTKLIKHFVNLSMILVAMGVETNVSFVNSIEEVVLSSSNVNRWVVLDGEIDLNRLSLENFIFVDTNEKILVIDDKR